MKRQPLDDSFKVNRNPVTLREIVLDKLRAAIMNFHLLPGDRLVERDLCDRLGVSRTSVREALRHLESEGLVEFADAKGPRVAIITLAGHTGAILHQINEAGFRIVAMKKTHLSETKAGEFYAVHKERPFYGELVEFMSSGPIVAAILEKDNAVEDFRTLIGATNPADAAPGTVRAEFAESVGENSVHGSDAPETAAEEIAFFFSGLELVG